jgi:class 3 adenylate cyclase
MERQREILYQEKINAGKMILGHFAQSAILPLVEGDVLTLNALVKEGGSLDGFVYGIVVNNKKIIKAHTDPAKIGLPLGEIEHIEARHEDKAVTTLTYRLPSGIRVLSLSKPVVFMNRDLGSVYLGLSMDSIDKEVGIERVLSMKKAFLPGAVVLAVVIGGTFLVGRHLNRTKATPKGSLQQTGADTTGYGGPPEESGNLYGTSRNQVTVLFSGIKGFRALAVTKNPEDTLEDLNEYLTIAISSILNHQGYVVNIIGDAVIGVFRSSPLQGNHTLRAVRSAVAMQKALEEASRKGNPLLSNVGIGISSGVVLSGPVGPEAKKEYTFIGESFKMAYSLNAMAGPGEIVISKDVYQSIESSVSVDPLPPREMMQRIEAWESFRLREIKGSERYG